MLTREAAEEAASVFAASRRSREPVAALPWHCRPQSMDDAYLIQEAFVRGCGVEVIGYKIGCASKQSQALAGSAGPIVGRLFAPSRFGSPAEISQRSFFTIGVEAEFAFEMGADLPLRPRPYGRDDVAAAVAAVVPAIEICDTRLADWKAAGIEHITADNAFNGGLVTGRREPDWKELDLAAHMVELSIDGALRGKGTGALVLGHPLDALAWIANELAGRGSALKSGDLVAAGTCTGLHFVRQSVHVVADFGSLGRVEISVTP